MAMTNLGRVQGAGHFLTTTASGTGVQITTIKPTNIKPLVGDSILFPNGDIRSITAINTTTATCGEVVINIKGATGAQGVPGVAGSYTFSNGTDGSFNVAGSTTQKVTIGKPATAGTADNTNNILMKVTSNTDAVAYDLIFAGTSSSSQVNTTTYRCRTTSNSNGLTYQPSTGNLSCAGNITAAKVYNAVFNDYAEYRLCKERIKAGYIVTEDETNCDFVKLCKTKKTKAKLFAVSDTFGNCMGVNKNSVSVALSGRVLLYMETKKNFKVGDYIGCSKNGRGRKLSRIEALFYPKRILGTVSSIPTYKTWGSDNVNVDGRIWVNLR